ncbi:MAG: DUF2059 domain-containing protein [Caulobacterales bacterium]
MRLELARQLYAASGGEQAAEDHIKQLYGSVNKMMGQMLPPDRAKLIERLQQDMQDELVGMVPQIIDTGARAYAQNLSEKELRDYLAWLRSDSGRALIQKMPVIRQKMLDDQLPLVSAMLPKMMQKAVDRACEETHCTADEHKLMVAMVAKLQQPSPSGGGG